MESGTALPCRVYAPTSGRFGEAISRDSTGVVVVFDDTDEPQYCQPVSVVEVVGESEGEATLIDGRVVLFGEMEVDPNAEHERESERNDGGVDR